MVISRTPFRISFFGGGTDYPAWYRREGGAVLATSIDKYSYIFCRYLPPFFNHKISVSYSQIEFRDTVDEINHPAVRAVLRHIGIESGIVIKYDGDLPARSGMGSSSAFTVGLLHALHALEGRVRSKRELAEEAIYVEQELLRETVGSQDQVLAAVGGLNQILFHPSGEISVHPLTLPDGRIRELESHLMLFFTGIARYASEVASSYIPSIHEREQELRMLREIVDRGIKILASGSNIREFGELLHESWEVKRSLSKRISSAQVDDLYARARAAGAIGGKLLGAGGGGFMLLFVPPERQAAVRAELNDFLHVPFHFESGGSQIIFYEPGRNGGPFAAPARSIQWSPAARDILVWRRSTM